MNQGSEIVGGNGSIRMVTRDDKRREVNTTFLTSLLSLVSTPSPQDPTE
jgi:hypothetical protein